LAARGRASPDVDRAITAARAGPLPTATPERRALNVCPMVR
jgi:hypothetical protein